MLIARLSHNPKGNERDWAIKRFIFDCFVGINEDHHQKYDPKLVNCQAMDIWPTNQWCDCKKVYVSLLSSDIGDSMVDQAYKWHHEDLKVEICTMDINDSK